MAVKKTAAAKKAATKSRAKSNTGPAKKTAAKKPGRPPAKKTATAKGKGKNVKNVSKPKQKAAPVREVNEETGFTAGTDQDLIAQALLEGGESRGAIVESLEDVIGTETRNGTPKMITNMVSGVLNRLLERGYTVEQSFVVVPPTPASKRAASRKKNKK